MSQNSMLVLRFLFDVEKVPWAPILQLGELPLSNYWKAKLFTIKGFEENFNNEILAFPIL